MAKPTEEQINAEITKLKTMKPNVKKNSMFGDDHHKAIDAQVEVLTQRMSDDQMYSTYDRSGVQESVLNAARDACDWLNGYREEVPSEEWADLLVS